MTMTNYASSSLINPIPILQQPKSVITTNSFLQITKPRNTQTTVSYNTQTQFFKVLLIAIGIFLIVEALSKKPYGYYMYIDK